MSAVAGPLRIAVGIVVVWLPLEIAVLPEIVVGPLETAVVIAFGASNLGHPKYFASPNVCSFPSCASSGGLVRGVFVGGSIDIAYRRMIPRSSLTQHLLDLTDLFLNFAGYLFTGTFSFQLWIIA
ncbi:MAG: hypothetical protein Q7J31_03990 [Syntrophales bacterium]|nr:hypothetical protein [Syntrophales bacterium]